MPNEHEAEDRIRLAERLGFEFSEQAIAAELFPNLDFGDRALLVGLRLAQTENYPDDPDDEDGVTGDMKEMGGVTHWATQIRESGLTEQFDEIQRIIFRKRYGDFS